MPADRAPPSLWRRVPDRESAPPSDAAPPDPLTGIAVFVVEDDPVLALGTELMLEELGCRVAAIAGDVPGALAVLAAGTTAADVAVLDVDLRGERVDPVAERLEAAGVPFVFATASPPEDLAPRWREMPLARKPFDAARLGEVLRAALTTARAVRADRLSPP